MASKRTNRKSGKSPRSGGSGDKGEHARLKEFLKSHIRAHGSQYLEDPNITSVGIGYKVRKGEKSKSKELCLQFTVARKVGDETQIEALGSRAILPTIDFNGVLVPTDIIEREFKPSYDLISLEAKDRRKQRLDTLWFQASASAIPKGRQAPWAP